MRSIYSALLLTPLAGLLLAATPAPDNHASQQTTITRLVLRDYQVTISAGDNGRDRYDIYTQNGHPLDTNLDASALQANYPALYDSLRPAVARDTEPSDRMFLMMENIDFQ